ncbi:hypothetical protein [Streptomyces sp. SID4985]|uniref:hypothetical protein n=1 Tax=Streptomyces sp. SID4985 TaxID=2690292 RepID=UPI001925BEB2|nr:hypothetical protein [Streptomyces sp. SID4985]
MDSADATARCAIMRAGGLWCTVAIAHLRPWSRTPLEMAQPQPPSSTARSRVRVRHPPQRRSVSTGQDSAK